jgi:uncharacterized repeat protein (TIGR01451 family)
VTFTYDPLLTYVSADPPPANVSAGTITWNLPGFGSYAMQDFNIYLQVPADPGLIGYVLSASLSAAQPFAESDLANNTHVDQTIITGGYDPNDKTARTSSGASASQFLIDQDEYIDYTIRFQNTGSDTAFSVVVTDTVDIDLDLSTFEQGVASNPFALVFRTGRVVEWRFDNINLPDSNTNEAASHGLVGFRIRPAQPWSPGISLVNNADIFFDFNPPIRTNDAVLLIESSTMVGTTDPDAIRLVPNPATEELLVLGLERLAPVKRARVRSADGRLVTELLTTARTIDVRDLPAGAYVLSLEFRDGAIRSQRFIKR